MTLDECDRQFKAVRAARSVAEACHELGPLLDAYQVISIGLARGANTTFWRARKAKETPWQTIEEMGYPPAGVAAIGRFNDRNAPFFYSAIKENTAFAEIEVNAGDFVQLAGFKVAGGAQVQTAVVGELLHVHKTGHLKMFGRDPGGTIARLLNEQRTKDGLRWLYIDAFLAHLLADPEARNSDYIHSRAVASMIMSRQGVDGFFFPSVRDPGGINLALTPGAFDSKLAVASCVHGRVNRVREFSFVDFEALKEVERQRDDGTLIWIDPLGEGVRPFFNLSKEEYEQAVESNRIRGMGARS